MRLRPLALILFLVLYTIQLDAIHLRLGLSTETQNLNTAFDCVNILTGEYFETHDDVAVDGPFPLHYVSYMESGPNPKTKGWRGVNQFVQFPLYAFTDSSGLLCVNQRDGAFLKWQKRPSGQAEISPDVYKWGYTNYGEGEISGRTHLRNGVLSFPANNVISVRFGDGLVRQYRHTYDSIKQPGHVWMLEKEFHPDGHRVHFQYAANEGDEAVLKQIRTTNATEDLVFNTLTVTRDPDKLGYTVQGSNGLKAHYQLKTVTGYQEIRGKSVDKKRVTAFLPKTRQVLSRVERTHAPSVTYEESGAYEFGYKNPSAIWLHTTRVNGEEGRYRAIGYYLTNGSVQCLQGPLGTDGTPITYASFVYGPRATEVYNAYKTKTVYRLTDEKRVTAIERYQPVNGQHQLYSAQQFRWGSQGALLGNLLARGVADANGKWCYATVGTYDDYGNVIKEELFGNLTGHSEGLFSLGADNKPVEPTDCYAIGTAYSADGYHLPIREVHDDGKVISYRYAPNSNRLISKLMGDNDRILSREFHCYNSDGILVETIQDDGVSDSADDLSGVTIRHITLVTPRRVAPAVGFPDSIVEQYWDSATGMMKQLQRKQLRYNAANLVEEETIYDADDQLSYSLQYVYDEKLNLIAKSDPMGRVTRWTYDANQNKVSEELVGSGFRTMFRYDLANRCIASEGIHDDGERDLIQYKYDYLGNKIAEIDAYGNEARFVYDAFSRLIEVHGLNSGVTKNTYNARDQLIAVTDPNGNTTYTSYNQRDEPTLIIHPDGSQQRREYYLNGALKTIVEPNGLAVRHHYDVLGRLVRMETCDPLGNVQCTLINEFQGAQLIRSYDALGIATEYTYDGAGRKIRECCADSRTEYAYDTLGRRSVTKSWYGPGENDYVTTIEEHDPLDRVIESRIEDASGKCHRKETRVYDILGHCTRTCVAVSDTLEQVAETRYNSRGWPTEQIDALGNVTYLSYDTHFHNILGQRVLLKTITDPLGKRTHIEHDVSGYVVGEWSDSASGVRLASYRQAYDLVGNRVGREDAVMIDGVPVRQMITQWSYDGCKRLRSLREAVGTADERTTLRDYNACGQLVRIQLPGGVELLHQYDALGHLSEHTASDSSFGYRYTYDALGNPLRIDDIVNGTTTLRRYDARRQVIAETLGNGLAMEYRYDGLGRMTHAQLPDQTAIAWVYDAVGLREVQRWNSWGYLNYRHQYHERDGLGHVLSETLLGYAGQAFHAYDVLERPISYQSTHYHETRCFDAVGNLIERQLTDNVGTIPCHYTYDPLYQLTHEDGCGTHEYQDDSLYNRASKDQIPHKVNALNALIDSGISRYEYDAKGCPTRSTRENRETQYRYDALGRLIEISTDAGVERYQYDSFHRRIWINDKRLLYIDQNEIGAADANGYFTQLRVLGEGLGAEIGAAVAIELQGYLYAVVHDLSGNVVALINWLGYPAETYRYSAFGEEQIFKPWQMLFSRLGNPWRFSSKRVDECSGLVYFGRRYYSPENGRWMTPDPLGYEAGPNLYAYVHNNPLTHIDLYGLYTECNRYRDRDYSRAGPIGRGAYNVSTNPLGTGSRYWGYTSQLGSAMWKGDFSPIIQKWNNLGSEGRWNFFNERCGEIGAAGAAVGAAIWMAPQAATLWAGSRAYAFASLAVRAGARAGMRTGARYLLNRQNATTEIASEVHAPSQVRDLKGFDNWSTGKIWNYTRKETSVQKAYRHWKDHGHQFPDLQNAKQYVQAARDFLNKPPPTALSRFRPNDGAFVVYDLKTETFAVRGPNGLPRTMYKPDPKIHNRGSNLEYFYEQ